MNRSRVLIQNNTLRKLFWIGEEIDGSIYIGNYLLASKHKDGQFTTPAKVTYSDEGFTHLDRETTMKISLHPKGRTHVKTQDRENQEIFRIDRDFLYSIEECKELAIFLPKAPDNYPIMDKKMSEGDIIIPLEIFKGKPFVLSLYLAQKDFEPNKLMHVQFETCFLCVWEGIIKFIIRAYQTQDTLKNGIYPPYEYWLFKHEE